MHGPAHTATEDLSDQVVTFTLVELLTALVFIAMILALVLRSEALRDLDPARENMLRLRQQLEQTEAKLKAIESENMVLREDLETQRSLVRRLMADSNAPLRPNDVIVEKEAYDRARNAIPVSQQQQLEIRGLLEQIAALKGGASVTRPYCTTNAGYLLTVQLNGDGTFTPVRNWPMIAYGEVRKIDGIEALAGGGRLSRAQFGSAASRVDSWAKRQAIPCAFRVRVTSSHANLGLYLKQLSAVEQSFYVARAK